MSKRYGGCSDEYFKEESGEDSDGGSKETKKHLILGRGAGIMSGFKDMVADIKRVFTNLQNLPLHHIYDGVTYEIFQLCIRHQGKG